MLEGGGLVVACVGCRAGVGMDCWGRVSELITGVLILDPICLGLEANNWLGLNDWLLKARVSDMTHLRVVVDF